MTVYESFLSCIWYQFTQLVGSKRCKANQLSSLFPKTFLKTQKVNHLTYKPHKLQQNVDYFDIQLGKIRFPFMSEHFSILSNCCLHQEFHRITVRR